MVYVDIPKNIRVSDKRIGYSMDYISVFTL